MGLNLVTRKKEVNIRLAHCKIVKERMTVI
jgi:hypothetical protein